MGGDKHSTPIWKRYRFVVAASSVPSLIMFSGAALFTGEVLLFPGGLAFAASMAVSSLLGWHCDRARFEKEGYRW